MSAVVHHRADEERLKLWSLHGATVQKTAILHYKNGEEYIPGLFVWSNSAVTGKMIRANVFIFHSRGI